MSRRRSRPLLRIAGFFASAAVLASLVWCRQRTSRPLASPSLSSSGSLAVDPPRFSVVPSAAQGSPWDSPAACESALRAGQRLPRANGDAARIVTWNVRWFPYGETPHASAEPRTDLSWLACAIAWLDADVIALQEVVRDDRGTQAMDTVLRRVSELTGGTWKAAFDSCAGQGRQHVGIVWDARRVDAGPPGEIAALNPSSTACGSNLRPGFGTYFKWPGGPSTHVVAAHLDSGTEERDYTHRVASWQRMAEAWDELQSRTADSDVVILGDFNTMGCHGRKGCEPAVSPEDELRRMDTVLRSLRAPFRRLPIDGPCTEYYHGRGQWLDQIVVSAGMAEAPAGVQVRVQGYCGAARCASLRSNPEAYERLSDHCPVVLDLPRRNED